MNEVSALCVFCVRVFICGKVTQFSVFLSVSALLHFLYPYEIPPPPFIFSGGKSLPRGRRGDGGRGSVRTEEADVRKCE